MNAKINTALRHGGVLFLFLIMLALVGASRDVTVGTAVTLVTFEIVALWSCYLVLAVFSPVNFIKKLIEAFDHEPDTDTQHTALAVYIICAVLVSVHLLFAGCVFGVYFTQFRPMP